MKANWIRAAMADDNLVAEFLLSLNRPDSLPPRRVKLAPPLPPLDWGMRQPRSKAAASLKKEQDARRRSPTTPLAWTASGFGSDAASPSDSYGESSRRIVLAARFKGSATPDTTNSESASKRPKRKRTFAELTEEESSLLKHREHLNKLDLHSQSATVNEHIGHHNRNSHPEKDASTSEAASNVSKMVTSEEISVSHNLYSNNSSNEQPTSFVLPDLNLMPGEDLAPEMMR